MFFRIFLFIQIISIVLAAEAEAGAMIRMQQNRVAQRQAYIQAQRQQAIMQQQQVVYQQVNQQLAERQRQVILQQRAMQQQQIAYQMALRNGAPASYLKPVGMHSNGNFIPEQDSTVELSKIAEKLETSSTMWPLILDSGVKETLISQYIKWYETQSVYIHKDPGLYVRLIDNFGANNKEALKQPFKNLVKIAAIMEYDFDNGQNKDMLARQYLGEQLYKDNKKRLGM